jgi:gliding-associated putative ABC transporter substrate-binding component GldG
MQRLLKSTYGIWLILLLVAGVYWLSGSIPGRLDLTADNRYTVSAPVKNMLRGLQEPVTITVLLEGESLPAAFKKLQSSTEGLLRIFRSYSGGQLRYRFVSPEAFLEDATLAPGFNDTLKGEWLKANAIKQNEVTRTGTKASFVYPLALVEAGEYSATVNLLQGQGQKGFLNPDADVFQREIVTRAEAQMEYLFAAAIQDLTRERLPKVAYLVGQGQPTGPETYDLSQTLQSKYDFYLLDLDRQPYISDSIDVVMVVKPSQPFSDIVKLKLDQYLMRGGNVMFLLDALHADMDSLVRSGTEFTAYARDLNLEDLLFRYGARINANLVQDRQSDMLPQNVGSIGGQPQIELLPWPYFPLLYGSGNHPISKNLDAVVMQFPNSVDTVQAAGIRKEILLASSNTSRVVGTPVIVTVEILKQLENASAFQDKNVPIAVLLEGPFKSLYARRMAGELAEAQKAMGIPYLPEAESPGKILITGDGDWVLGGVSRQGLLPMGVNPFTQYTFANRDFLLNTIDYMTDPSGIMATRNRDFALRLLDPKKLEKQANTWRWINIGAPMLILLMAAFVVSVTRRKRYAG